MRIYASSSIRADYDLLSGVYRALHAADEVELGLVVGGAHLSRTFGETVCAIEEDDLPIAARIPSLLDSDRPEGRAKTTAVFLQGAVDVLATGQPDLVLVTGDREDALAMVVAAAYQRIPSVHFFGGQHALDGNIDNSVRHAISKLATWHFVATRRHAERLKTLGEPTTRIQVVGSPALDKFREEPRLEREEVLAEVPGTTGDTVEEYAVMIHHPLLGREEHAGEEAENILEALLAEEIPAFVSYPNTDAGAREILDVYERYGDEEGLYFYKNLPRTTFVNLLRHARFLVGNSSLGLLEAPSISLPAVNVGPRQEGRLAAENIVFVGSETEEIQEGIRRVSSSEFREQLEGLENPYGDGHSVPRIVSELTSLDLSGDASLKQEDPLGNREGEFG